MTCRMPAALIRFLWGPALIVLASSVMLIVVPFLAGRTAADDQDDIEIALSLAAMLPSARSVISRHQDLINDPERGDKGLTGDLVLAEAIEDYKRETSRDPMALDPNSRHGRLMRAEMAAIKEVMDESQELINEKGLGFKGFIPAIFGRLITERLREKVPTELNMKVTAPPELVRNRKSRPDAWELEIIESKFLSPTWTRGEIYHQTEKDAANGRRVFRVLVPEYYSASCLTCHGGTKGEIDITGYPKEGASEGDLGGVISITLFQPAQ